MEMENYIGEIIGAAAVIIAACSLRKVAVIIRWQRISIIAR